MGERPHEPASRSHPSDAATFPRIRSGETRLFDLLASRHYPAVLCYARCCVQDDASARALAQQAFADLLGAIHTVESVFRDRYMGCVRLHLLDRVRHAAVKVASRDPALASPGFRTWVAQGALWELPEGIDLNRAFIALPAVEQRLLWHGLIESDSAELASQVTGIPRSALMDAYRSARDTFVSTAGLDRLEEPDRYAYQSLPPALLGWWPRAAYFHLKNAGYGTSPPPPSSPGGRSVAYLVYTLSCAVGTLVGIAAGNALPHLGH
ncbi:hypothetical protein ABVG11_23495 [Streptomyces sp. HD1123-B1]|uniref:RNA polymerase sigma factor n=1 Tax=Streptomyces huangiella TaxID=3228804 RepID=UPI003D7D5163